MTDDASSVAKCLAFVGERLLLVAQRDEPGAGRDAQLQALELLAAACVAEAARTSTHAEGAAPRPQRGPESPSPDPGPRGAWAPPEWGTI